MMKKKNSMILRALGIVLCLALTTSNVSGAAILPEDSSGVIRGTYFFTSNEESNIQLTDEFVWRDECFTYSSFRGCGHLRLLSTQAALASASRYGGGPDKYERDCSDCAENIKAMLRDMGFNYVEANQWYSKETQENSLGVAMGLRKIIQDGKTYTLLAIIPRSAGYKQEWVGNFNVGTGDFHQGFKEARDEALRFAKQYIKNHNVTGDLKVWIAGHSRGGAVSNLLGGFFAGGGIDYFGDAVSITPQDVYCYTFATPRNIKSGVANNTILSVGGARGGVYQYDTPGEPYEYSGGGAVVPTDEIYTGIRNYPFNYDVITYLPPALWGFTNYGQYCTFEDVTEEQMRKELSSLSPYAYNKYINGGVPSQFREKTLDLATLSTKDREGGRSGVEGWVEFLEERIAGFAKTFPTNEAYVNNGYQKTLQSYISMYGMLTPVMGNMEEMATPLIQPLIVSYLHYAYTRLKAEGKANSEGQASALALADLLSIFLEKPINIEDYKVDEFFADVTKFVADNEDKEIPQKILGLLEKQVPENYADIVRLAMGGYCPGFDTSKPRDIPISKIIAEFIKACAYGPDPESKAYESGIRDPREVRNALYGMVSLMSLFGDDTITALSTAINGGNGSFEGLVNVLIDILKQNKDAGTGSNPTTPYATLDDAANGELTKALNKIEEQVFKVIEDNHLYTEEFKQQIRQHLADAKDSIPKIRECVMNMLFGDTASYNTEYNIYMLATFMGNVGIIPPAHYNETFVAWARAGEDWNEEVRVRKIPLTGYV